MAQNHPTSVTRFGVALLRVSTDKQFQEGESIEAQRRKVEFAAKRERIDIVRFFTEHYSGRKSDRRVLEEMFEFLVENADVKCVLVGDIDRFTRGGTEIYLALKRRLYEMGVSLLDTTGIIQPDRNRLEHLGVEYDWSIEAPSRYAEIFMAEKARSEASDILTRLIGQQIQLTRDGYQVRPANFGYRNIKITLSDGTRKTIMEPEPDEALFVRRIFELRAEGGISDQQISDHVNAMGYKSRGRRIFDPTTRTSSYVNILKNIWRIFLKRALVIGIDHYEHNNLANCEQDAQNMATLLERNSDGSKNFDTNLILSDGEEPVSRGRMMQGIKALFSSPAEMALLYFAGHGVFDQDTSAGTLIAQNGEEDSVGVAMGDIIALASAAWPSIKTTVIILDCCNSGAAGDLQGSDRALLGQGMTILTSSDRSGEAHSEIGGGVFTSIMLDALEGAAADIRGNITPAAVYTHVDQSLGSWAQRPIYKANVREFVSLRQVKPKIPDTILRKLPEWFPEPGAIFPLNPSFEPDIKKGSEDDYSPEERAINQETFVELQLCNRYGLIKPVGADHMYFAATEKTGCELSPLGVFIRSLAGKGVI
jgi:hypothetical protein